MCSLFTRVFTPFTTCSTLAPLQLIRPEEMVDPRVDEKAMMTYLAQYPNAKLREGAPLRPKANPARVRAYGPGAPRPFTLPDLTLSLTHSLSLSLTQFHSLALARSLLSVQCSL